MIATKPHLQYFDGAWNCGTRYLMRGGYALLGYVRGHSAWIAYWRWTNSSDRARDKP